MNQSHDLPDAFVLLQRIHRWRMAFFSVIILLAGTVIGASGMFIWNRHRLAKPRPQPTAKSNSPQKKPEASNPAPPWVVMSKNLDRHLKLTDEQYKDLHRILRQHWTQLNKIKQEARPKIREALLSLNEKVLALLDEKQKTLWRQNFRRLQLQFQLDYRPTVQNKRSPSTQNRDARSDKDAPSSQREPASTAEPKDDKGAQRSNADTTTRKKPTPQQASAESPTLN